MTQFSKRKIQKSPTLWLHVRYWQGRWGPVSFIEEMQFGAPTQLPSGNPMSAPIAMVFNEGHFGGQHLPIFEVVSYFFV